MPLIQGYSKKSVSKNIGKLLREGKKKSQAVAIAMETARRAKKKLSKRK